MMSSFKKDNRQTIFNILSQLILNGTNFILIMLFTRYLNTNDYGVVSIYQAYVTFLAIIVGLNSQGSIGTAFVHFEKEKHNFYISSILLLAMLNFIAICFLATIFMPVIVKFTELSSLLIYLILFQSFGVFCFNLISINYTYLRKAQYGCAWSFKISISMIAISIASINLNKNNEMAYLSRILSLAIPYIVCAVFVLISVYLKANPFINLKESWKFCLPICLPLVFHGVSQVILAQTDKIMLQKFLNDNSYVGVYSFFATFVHVLNSIYIALNNTWVPIYYEYTKQHQKSIILSRSKSYCKLFSGLVIGFMMVSPEIIKLLADRNYWSGMKLIPIIAFSIFMIFLYTFAVNFELYYQKTKWIALGTSAAAACNITINAILIPLFGIYGAAIATLVSYILLWLFHEICARKIAADFPYKIKFYYPYIISIIISSLLFYLFLNIWIVRWLFAILVAIVIILKTIKNKVIF